MHLLLYVLTLFAYVKSDLEIIQTPQTSSVQESQAVTLQCSLGSGQRMGSYYMNWYRQRRRQAPELVYAEAGSVYGPGFQGRFTADLQSSNNKFSLRIGGAELGDSAVYFCAARAHLGYMGRFDAALPLIFGKGTQLTVKPKRSDTVKGTLNVLQPFDDKGPTACLASMYFDNDGDMTLTDNNDKVSSQSKDLALLSKKDRLYYLAGVSDNGIKNCTHKGRASQKKQDSEKATTATPTVETEECQSRNDTAKKDTKDFAKLNFMSLTVNGLRMLFAKTVTFNMLMTVRAMII